MNLPRGPSELEPGVPAKEELLSNLARLPLGRRSPLMWTSRYKAGEGLYSWGPRAQRLPPKAAPTQAPAHLGIGQYVCLRFPGWVGRPLSPASPTPSSSK